MIANKYRYMMVDSSYLLTRNNFIASKNPEYKAGDVVRMFIYSIKKFMRDYGITTDKVILLNDTWSPDYGGYYRTHLLKGLYKDDRKYVTEADITEDLSDEEKKKLEFEAYRNKVKQEAKKIIREELGKFGMPTVSRSGLEADDISYIYSSLMYGCNKPSVSVSKDSDWMYLSVNPRVDFFKMPTGGSEPETFTYDRMIREVPDELRSKISLYQWKYLYDSIEGSHNSMRKTRKERTSTPEIIKKIILYEDYSDIENYDIFQRQYSSSCVERFPGFDGVVKSFYLIDKMGKLGTLEEFKEFNDKYNIGISDRYFLDLINRFDKNLYSE